LILDRLPVSQSQGVLIQRTVETETARLLAEQGLNHWSRGAVPHLSADSIQITRDIKPEQLGHQIAVALIKSIGNNKVSNKHKGD